MLSANQITGFFKMPYLKKKVNEEIYFWHADKHRSILQVHTIILCGCKQTCPKYLKWQIISPEKHAISPEKHADEVDFLHEDKIKVFNKLIVSLWVGIARHAQSTQNNKFAISLQFSRKTWRTKLNFCLQINVKALFKLVLSS